MIESGQNNFTDQRLKSSCTTGIFYYYNILKCFLNWHDIVNVIMGILLCNLPNVSFVYQKGRYLTICECESSWRNTFRCCLTLLSHFFSTSSSNIEHNASLLKSYIWLVTNIQQAIHILNKSQVRKGYHLSDQ
jgi:hypothetical protein